jgi:hypothetical protein
MAITSTFMTSNQRNICQARKSSSSFFAAACVLGMPALANAQGVDEFGVYGPPLASSERQSPLNFALEVRFGPYLPRVDSEFTDGSKPFERYFGTKNRVALGLEFDWLPLAIPDVLRFGPGFGLMYTTMSAHAFIHNFPDERAGQTTALRVLPHWATAVLHVDALAKRTFIPVVLTAKLGLAEALWWVKDEPKNRPARIDGQMTDIKGEGRSYGLYYGIGAQLDLSFLDTQRRKRLDSFTGINSIYFFGEFYGLELNGFGSSGVMNVGDRSWVLGLAFDI